MRKQSWIKRDPIKNYFPLPNEIYSLGLSSTIYGYLLCREDRKTYERLASYRMIGEAIGKSVTTVRKYVCELEKRSLITTERTSIITKDGRKWNGCLRCHILPIRSAVKQFNERQLRAAELGWERKSAGKAVEAECGAGAAFAVKPTRSTHGSMKRCVKAVRLGVQSSWPQQFAGRPEEPEGRFFCRRKPRRLFASRHSLLPAVRAVFGENR